MRDKLGGSVKLVAGEGPGGLFADIIAITAVRELNIVRSAVATGVVQYQICFA